MCAIGKSVVARYLHGLATKKHELTLILSFFIMQENTHTHTHTQNKYSAKFLQARKIKYKQAT